MRRWLFAMSTLVCTTALVAACGVGTDCDFGLCAGAVVGSDGGDSGPDVIAPPNGCKPELDPRDAAPCVVNDFGIFVAPDGKADAPGTREAPVNSIASALKIVGNKPRIYVCKGIYAENIELSTAVSIFGGFACGTWSYSSEKAVFGATAPGQYGLRVRSVAADIVIADIEVSAKPGDQTSLSSITAFVSDSPKLTLRRVTLIAGEGHDGSNGNPGTTGASTPSDLNGNPPKPATSGGEGGAAKSCSCSSGGTTKGGRGGDTLGLAISGADGETVMPIPSPATATGMAQTASDCLNTINFARAGSNAPAGKNADPPLALGDITTDGLKPSNGDAGVSGKPGQGGGGAGGNSGGGSPGGGGGGACGGCGGTGGGGGAAGGSSVALLAINSPIKLEGSSLTSKRAGKGGAGAVGGPPLPGGLGGVRAGSCSGGPGGIGGMGGAGAGGSGGVSAGVLHKDGAPAPDASTDGATVVGDAGPPGAGGIPGTNDGKPGDAKKVLAL